MNNSFDPGQRRRGQRPALIVLVLCVFGAWVLSGCGSPAKPQEPTPAQDVSQGSQPEKMASIRDMAQSRWIPVSWQELPGWGADALHEAWQAAIANCERANAALASLCPQVRQLSLADETDKRVWLETHLQPYRVQSHQGANEGLLTGYYEPVLHATRLPQGGYRHAVYQMPLSTSGRTRGYTRQEIDMLGEAATGLSGRQIAYLADPVDVLIMQIQGSARVWITEPDGSRRMVRLSFAGTNGHPYQSVARWLLDKRDIRDASWASIKAWVSAQAQTQPEKVQAMLWSNPRMVFFREEQLPLTEGVRGPRGAQGVPLTAGRSIAVDKGSIPYGTPVWLVSSGTTVHLKRLVFAQDTGSAIVGAVRADYYAGSGEEAGQLAGKLKQSLQLWALWPKGSTP